MGTWNYNRVGEEFQAQRLFNTSNIYHPEAGASLSIFVELLRETHDLFALPQGSDAMFINRKYRHILNKEYGIYLPADEFKCFFNSEAWLQWPSIWVKSWA